MSSSTVRAHSVPVPTAVLRHRRQVVRWALATGRSVNRDALAAIVGTRAEDLSDPSGVLSPTTWTADDIGELLWGGITAWCTEQFAEAPGSDDMSRTLDTYLRYLSANRLLAVGSDTVAALRRAITDYGGHRSRTHPAARHLAPAPVVPIA